MRPVCGLQLAVPYLVCLGVCSGSSSIWGSGMGAESEESGQELDDEYRVAFLNPCLRTHSLSICLPA